GSFLRSIIRVARAPNDARITASAARKARDPVRSPGRGPGPAGGGLLWRESLILLLVPVVLYLVACLASYSPSDPGWSRAGSLTAGVQNFGGLFGAWLADISLYFLGSAAWLLPLLLAVLVWDGLLSRRASAPRVAPALRLLGFVAVLVAAAGLAVLHHAGAGAGLPASAGGIIGQLGGGSLPRAFGPLGSSLFLLALFLVAVTLATGLSWFGLMDRIGRGVLAL